MRIFYEAWKSLEPNSSVETDELQLTNYDDFPITAFLNIGFTHHTAILSGVKTMEERKFYIQVCYDLKLSVEELQKRIAEDVFHNQGQMPNNFVATIGSRPWG